MVEKEILNAIKHGYDGNRDQSELAWYLLVEFIALTIDGSIHHTSRIIYCNQTIAYI
jgi:hypothetical protein